MSVLSDRKKEAGMYSIKHHSMKTNGGAEVQFHAFLSLELVDE
jgi:hypothetical protein